MVLTLSKLGASKLILNYVVKQFSNDEEVCIFYGYDVGYIMICMIKPY